MISNGQLGDNRPHRLIAGAGNPDSGDWSKGTVLLDDFEVERELGQGGMGKVYLVRNRIAGHQFAVKRTVCLDTQSRRNFQTELQVWIELPEYPHWVACRFFRTIGDEIAVFAQYIEGGSLADWIRDRKLTSVPQILDVAIQTAWGLHALHESSLVHQDMKPSNVLMTSDGLAKITDFGLVKARVSAGERPSTVGDHASILVSSGGRTPAYCSPEQAAGLPLTRKTDIWSWAASVLEMFTGEVTWLAGQAVDTALEEYWTALHDGKRDFGISPMPRAVAGVLRKCLRQEPNGRWLNLLTVADELRKSYREAAGREYARQMPSFATKPPSGSGFTDSDSSIRSSSFSAFQWLSLAYQAAGRPAPSRTAWRAPRVGSAKVQTIANLGIYDEAERVLQSLVAQGRHDLEGVLAAVCMEKADLHWKAEDFSGGLACYDRAITTLKRLVSRGCERKYLLNLTVALSEKAQAIQSVGEIRVAVGLIDEAIGFFKSLLRDRDDFSVKSHLAGAYHTKGNAAYELADYDEALLAYDKEIETYQQLADHIEVERMLSILATAYMSKGNAVWSRGNAEAALVWHDKAIENWKRLVELGDKSGSRELAKNYYNKAITLRSQGEARQALEWHDRSTELYEKLVREEGRWEIANELANVYIARANTMCDLSQNRESVTWYDRAIDIYDTLVSQQGRQEFSGDLARVRVFCAAVLFEVGEHDRGHLESERAHHVLRREAARTGRSDLRNALRRLENLMQRYGTA